MVFIISLNRYSDISPGKIGMDRVHEFRLILALKPLRAPIPPRSDPAPLVVQHRSGLTALWAGFCFDACGNQSLQLPQVAIMDPLRRQMRDRVQ